MSKATDTLSNVLSTNKNLSKNFKEIYSDPTYATGAYLGNGEYHTPYSSVVGGMTSIDPSVRSLQDSYLQNNNDLRGRYTGNMSAYRQALLNPLIQQLSAGRGELQRSVGMRGLAGSSFGDQAFMNYDTNAGNVIGDASAKAENQDFTALNQLNQNDYNVGQNRLSEEMAALGLSQQQVQQMMGSFEDQQKRKIMQETGISNLFNAQTNAVYGWIPAGHGGGNTANTGGSA